MRYRRSTQARLSASASGRCRSNSMRLPPGVRALHLGRGQLADRLAERARDGVDSGGLLERMRTRECQRQRRSDRQRAVDVGAVAREVGMEPGLRARLPATLDHCALGRLTDPAWLALEDGPGAGYTGSISRVGSGNQRDGVETTSDETTLDAVDGFSRGEVHDDDCGGTAGPAR